MINPLTYLSEVNTELKKVTWPKAKDTIKLTTTVLIIAAIVGAFLGALDIGFTKLLEFVLT